METDPRPMEKTLSYKLGSKIMKYSQEVDFFGAIWDFFALFGLTFLHHNFGERFYSWGKIVAAWGLALVAIVTLTVTHLIRDFDGTVLFIAWVAYGITALLHRLRIRKRNKAKVMWHSRYTGEPHLEKILPWRESHIKRFAEPALLAVGGWLISFITAPLGISFIFGGFVLFLQAHANHMRLKNQILDMQDAMLDSQYMHDAVRQVPASQTAGVTVDIDAAELMGNVVNHAQSHGIEPPSYLKELKPALDAGFEDLKTKAPVSSPSGSSNDEDEPDYESLKTRKD